VGENSKIEWCTHTWNPWRGCEKVSPGCKNCYAEARDKRFTGGKLWGPDGSREIASPSMWKQPILWNRNAQAAAVNASINKLPEVERPTVFCASLADIFEDRPELDEYRARVMDMIERTPSLDWLLLTKRPQNITNALRRALAWIDAQPRVGLQTPAAAVMLFDWLAGRPPPNVRLGTSAEDQPRLIERLGHLLEVPAHHHFVSFEPLIGPIDLCAALFSISAHPEPGLHALTWAIIGGESGHGARPFHIEWCRRLVIDCRRLMVSPFVKQMGAVPVMDESAWREQFERNEREGSFAPILSATNKAKALPGTVALKLEHPKGGDMEEWSADLRVREFPGEFA
jgi:protein gp37